MREKWKPLSVPPVVVVGEADWQSPTIPPSIHRPWQVFARSVEDLAAEAASKDQDPGGEVRRRLASCRQGGARLLFQGLPTRERDRCTAVSLVELSAFVRWSNAEILSSVRAAVRSRSLASFDVDARKRALATAWDAIGYNDKIAWMAEDPLFELADNPVWSVFLEEIVNDAAVGLRRGTYGGLLLQAEIINDAAVGLRTGRTDCDVSGPSCDATPQNCDASAPSGDASAQTHPGTDNQDTAPSPRQSAELGHPALAEEEVFREHREAGSGDGGERSTINPRRVCEQDGKFKCHASGVLPKGKHRTWRAQGKNAAAHGILRAQGRIAAALRRRSIVADSHQPGSLALASETCIEEWNDKALVVGISPTGSDGAEDRDALRNPADCGQPALDPQVVDDADDDAVVGVTALDSMSCDVSTPSLPSATIQEEAPAPKESVEIEPFFLADQEGFRRHREDDLGRVARHGGRGNTRGRGIMPRARNCMKMALGQPSTKEERTALRARGRLAAAARRGHDPPRLRSRSRRERAASSASGSSWAGSGDSRDEGCAIGISSDESVGADDRGARREASLDTPPADDGRPSASPTALNIQEVDDDIAAAGSPICDASAPSAPSRDPSAPRPPTTRQSGELGHSPRAGRNVSLVHPEGVRIGKRQAHLSHWGSNTSYTRGTWGKANAIAAKQFPDNKVERLKLAQRLYARTKTKAALRNGESSCARHENCHGECMNGEEAVTDYKDRRVLKADHALYSETLRWYRLALQHHERSCAREAVLCAKKTLWNASGKSAAAERRGHHFEAARWAALCRQIRKHALFAGVEERQRARGLGAQGAHAGRTTGARAALGGTLPEAPRALCKTRRRHSSEEQRAHLLLGMRNAQRLLPAERGPPGDGRPAKRMRTLSDLRAHLRESAGLEEGTVGAGQSSHSELHEVSC